MNFDRQFLKISYNYLAFFVTAAPVLFINLFLLSNSQTVMLAVFNFSYMVSVIGSQFSVFGIHQAILYQISNQQRQEFTRVISALISSALISVIIIPLTIILLSLEKNILGEFKLQTIILCSLVIPILAFNKILFAYLNGKNLMVEYANANMLRGLTVLICLALWVNMRVEYSLFCIIIFSELTVLLYTLFIFLSWTKIDLKSSKIMHYIITNLNFGKYAAIGSIAIESNIRIDCIFISLFTNPTTFAAYSFLSLIFEGMLTALTIIRNFANVYIVDINNRYSRVKILTLQKYSISIATIMFIVSNLGYWFVEGELFASVENFHIVFIILSGTLVMYSSVSIFEQIENQRGNPKRYLTMAVLAISINVFLNIALIQLYGAIGAAVSTFASYCALLLFILKSVQQYKEA